MSSIRKYIAEFLGTMVLVLIGCGTAMTVGCSYSFGGGYVLTALAFGLAVMVMAYTIGNISGCHINPAISFGSYLCGDMSFKDFILYVISQVLGAFAGTGILALVFSLGGKVDLTGKVLSSGTQGDYMGFGSNGLAGVGDSTVAALVVEVVLTFVFVLLVLTVSSRPAYGSVAGLIIGLGLTVVHILGIGLTGTSVNPARSMGPAVVAAITGNPDALPCLWVFVVGPLLGAVLAAFAFKLLVSPKTPKEIASQE